MQLKLSANLLQRLFLTIGVLILNLCVQISSPYPAYAEEQELQQWSVVTLNVDLPHKLRLAIEAQPRVGFNTQGLESNGVDRLILRPVVGYQLTPNLSIWQGYGWTPSFRPGFQNEHRIFQQLLLSNKLKKLKISNRIRLEERFIEGAGKTAIRARHLIRAAYPIDQNEQWDLVGSNEFFVNLNHTNAGIASGIDQNRIYAGISRRIGKAVSAEAGYMLNYVNRTSPQSNKINHIILLTLNLYIKD